MTTVKELAQYLGRSGHFWLNAMEVAVTVLDARISYGFVQLQIEPVSGRGTAWVQLESVQLIEEGK